MDLIEESAELIFANKKIAFQNDESEKQAAELIIANEELAFQNSEKENRAAELLIANKELIFQNGEKEKCAEELIIANKELVFQNEEKEKRAAELIVAKKELVFQKTTAKTEEQKFYNLTVESEKRFRALIENGTDLIALRSPGGKILYASPSIPALVGCTMEDLLRTPVYELIHPEDVPGLKQQILDILKTPGGSFFRQQRYRHKNGNWIWCEGTVTNMLHEPGINALVSNFRDITEKKKNKEQQEFDRNNLDALINNTNDLMWSIDRDFNLITSNRPFDQMVKSMSGSAIAKGSNILSMAFPAEQLTRFKLAYERAFKGENFTEIVYTETPLEFWSEISYYPIRKGDEIIGTACHSRDITKIKKAEQQVIINERRYRALVENGADAVVILSAAGAPIYASPSVERVLGYNEEELMKMDVFSILHPDDVPGVTKVWEQVMASSGIPIPGYTSRMLHKNGTWRWLEATVTNMLHDPAINGIVDNFRDVTEKIKVEQKLRHSEIFNRGVLNSLTSHIAVIDFSGNIVAVNEAWTRFGMENGETVLHRTEVGSNYFNVCLKSGREGVEEAFLVLQGIKDVMNERTPDFYLEYPCHSPTQQHWFVLRVTKIKSDEKLVVIAHHNITDRKMADKKLLESEQKFRALASELDTERTRLVEAQAMAKVGSWETDLQSLKINWSQECHHIFETDSQNFEVTYAAFREFVHPEDRAISDAAFSDSIHDGSAAIEHRIITAKGHNKFVLENWKVFLDEKGLPLKAVGTCQDITERKFAELERIKIINDLIQRNKDLEQFSYIVSHNLRAPVANILGAVSILDDESLTDEDKLMINKGINGSVTQLDHVVKDLNHILQVKSEINELKEKVTFSALVDDIEMSIRNIITTEVIEIKYDFSEVGELSTVRSYLYSIFYNLISNSIKYRQPKNHCIIEIKSQQAKGKIQLFFTDNGMGIDLPKNVDQVFGLYKKFHPNIEGKGMGLFMVKTQVEALGGKISISSHVNKGTEFKIEFEK